MATTLDDIRADQDRDTHQDAYPICHRLGETILALGEDDLVDPKRTALLAQVYSIVGEYEHGAVDVVDVTGPDPVTLEQYAAVALDVAMSMDLEVL